MTLGNVAEIASILGIAYCSYGLHDLHTNDARNAAQLDVVQKDLLSEGLQRNIHDVITALQALNIHTEVLYNGDRPAVILIENDPNASECVMKPERYQSNPGIPIEVNTAFHLRECTKAAMPSRAITLVVESEALPLESLAIINKGILDIKKHGGTAILPSTARELRLQSSLSAESDSVRIGLTNSLGERFTEGLVNDTLQFCTLRDADPTRSFVLYFGSKGQYS
jgi:hypothetical protein